MQMGYQCEKCGANLDPSEKCDCEEKIDFRCFDITVSTTQAALIWQQGGYNPTLHFGYGLIVTDAFFRPVKAYAYRRETNGKHCLHRLEKGMNIVYSENFYMDHRKVWIYEVVELDLKGEKAVGKCIYYRIPENQYHDIEWIGKPGVKVEAIEALEAAEGLAELEYYNKALYIKK